MKINRKVNEGQKYTNVKGYVFTVVEYINHNKIKIKFDEPRVSYKYSCTANILSGKIANPYHVIASGVGYMGEGLYQPINDPKIKRVLCLWRAMLARCYESGSQKSYKTYAGCTVSEDWHNFQNFAEWYMNHEFYGLGYDLDKDLLVRGNKVYSSETCCMLPHELNTSLPKTEASSKSGEVGVHKNRQGKYQAAVNGSNGKINLGVYRDKKDAVNVWKSAKKKLILELAEKWKYLVAVDVYESLVNLED